MVSKDKLYDELVRICEESSVLDGFINDNNKYIKVEHCWKNRYLHALRLDFVRDIFCYDTYEVTDDDLKHEKTIEGDIFECLEAFDQTEIRKMHGSRVFNIDRTQFEIKVVSKADVIDWLVGLLKAMFLSGRQEIKIDIDDDIHFSAEPAISGDVAKAYQTMLTLRDDEDWTNFLTDLSSSGNEPFSISFKVSPELLNATTFNELVNKVYLTKFFLGRLEQGDFFLGGIE